MLQHPTMQALLGGCVCAFIIAPSISAASFTPLGDFPGGIFFSKAHAISADGTTVVGFGNGRNMIEAFRWRLETGMVGLGDLPGGAGEGSSAEDVSADGSVVVGGADSLSDDFDPITVSAFRWSEDTGMIELEGPNSTDAFAVTADGQDVFGTTPGFHGSCATIWPDGGTEPENVFECLGNAPIHSCTPDGAVLGGGDIGSIATPFVWSEADGATNLDPAHEGQVEGLSDDGAVATGGRYDSSPFLAQGFRWTEATGLVVLPGQPSAGAFTWGNSITSDGKFIVGYSESGPTPFHAVLWDAANQPHDLRALLIAQGALPSASLWQLREAFDITRCGDHARIVGWGINPAGDFEAWLAEVTLPGAVLGDLNGDGVVNGADLGILLAAWETNNCASDLNGDGTVNGADLGILLAAWT